MSIKFKAKINKNVTKRFVSSVKGGFRPVGGDIKKMMRFGAGSIAAQFEQETTITPSGRRGWKPKSTPWGSRKTRGKAGQESGRYRNAWVASGPGSFSKATPVSVTVGLQESKFPQVTFLQKDSPSTWFPRKRLSTGLWAAHLYHGVFFNVWIPNERFTRGFIHNPRAVSVNNLMTDRIARYMEQYLAWSLDPVNNRKPRPVG